MVTLRAFSLFVGLFLHKCQISLARVLINSSMSALEVAAIACGDNRPAVLTSFLGVIQSLNYPNGSEGGIQCEYVIDIQGVNPNSGVAVMLRHFNTEPDFDVVKIYKGEGVSSDRLINTLSGSVRSGTTYESQDETQLTITFENDCFTSYLKGFEFMYYSLDGSETAQANAQKACHEGEAVLLVNEANPTAFIETPNFPDLYPRGTSCTWVVKSTCRRKSRNLTLTSLRFETNTDDWLDVYRDRGSQEKFLQRFDGQHNAGFEVDIGYGTMQARFTTNSRYGDNGFRLAVHFTDE